MADDRADDRADDHGSAPVTGDAYTDGLARMGEDLPFNRHLGVEVIDLGPGRAVTRLRADDRLHNHLAGVHAIAELAPMELAGALAAGTRLRPLLERGYVPVLGALSVKYLAAARGELVATALVDEDVLNPALAAADADERPRVEVSVELHDADGTLTVVAELRFVYLEVSRTLT
jgi:acyl-coenzyme A thioesterase PaaI-like protein